jgi:F-type H+-transporting ATPase subunit delta
MLKKTALNKISKDFLEEIWGIRQYEEILFEMKGFLNFLDEANLERFMIDISKNLAEKKLLITEEVSEFDSENVIFLNLINTLIQQGHIELFSKANFRLLIETIESEIKKFKRMNLTTAIRLKDEDLAKIKRKLEKKYGVRLLLNVKIKPNIIGGFILEKDSKIIDASVQNGLEDYRKSWIEKIFG